MVLAAFRAQAQLSPGRKTQPQKAGGAPKVTLTTPRNTPSIAELGVEPRWEQRSFRHTEFTTPNVRSYDANGYASFALVAGLYPFARGGSPLWQGLGLTFRYARAFGFDSESARFGAENRVRPLPVDTYFWRYDASLRYRIAVNPQGRMPLELAVSAGAGGWSFDFGSDLPRAPDLEAPTADYRMLRLGFDAAARLPPVTFFASFGYLHAFSIAAPSSRELDDLHYPHLPSAAGIGAEMRGAVGVTIWQKLELRLSAEYAVLAFHLKPLPGRADAPARVVDAYLSIGLGPYVSF